MFESKTSAPAAARPEIINKASNNFETAIGLAHQYI
jgi:hypothetical protein